MRERLNRWNKERRKSLELGLERVGEGEGGIYVLL